MANHHKLILIGRLARDPEFKSFGNGGGVAKFGLPVEFKRNKKNPQTGAWEGGESFFINVDVFNNENRKLADLVMQLLKKGSQVYVEGRLRNNEYTDKTGTKVSRPVLVADTIQFLDSRGEGSGMDEGFGGSRATTTAAPRKASAPPASAEPVYYEEEPEFDPSPSKGGSGGGDDEIPF